MEKMTNKQFIESNAYLGLQTVIQTEINNGTFYITATLPRLPFVPKSDSFERFKKSKQERLETNKLKLNHKNKLRRAGYNPAKQMNIPGELIT
jgi:hypothetical protein